MGAVWDGGGEREGMKTLARNSRRQEKGNKKSPRREQITQGHLSRRVRCSFC